jgi:hypothetical protein
MLTTGSAASLFRTPLRWPFCPEVRNGLVIDRGWGTPLKTGSKSKRHAVLLPKNPSVVPPVPAGVDAPRIETVEEFKLDFTEEHTGSVAAADEVRLPGERTADEEVIAPRNPME